MAAEGLHTDKAELTEYIYGIINNTADNYSSMLQDMRNNRRTEIDYITGFLIKQARAHGISTPENDRLYHLVKNREQQYDDFRSSLHRSWGEEIEFTITADLLVRAGINVSLASVTEDGSLTITASRGLKLLPIPH